MTSSRQYAIPAVLLAATLFAFVILLLMPSRMYAGTDTAPSIDPPPEPAAVMPAIQASPAVTEAVHSLQAYFVDNCGPPPNNARSCDWGVYHEYSGITHGAMVTGSTTSETQNLMIVFESLYDYRYDDSGGFTGTLNYLRDYMMPHDGQNDLPHEYQGDPPPFFPCLGHWLIEVDGGTVMRDTGTEVGPNTNYLPYEEDPPDPDPDRESYISPTDYKYASATDAELWGAAGLYVAAHLRDQDKYADLADCIVDSLLDYGLTGPDDFRYLLLDDFEDNDISDWWAYAGAGAQIITGTQSPGADDTRYHMVFTYTVPFGGFAGVGKTIEQDWSKLDGIRFWFKGDGSGNQIRVVLTDPAEDAPDEALGREYFQYLVTDTETGWHSISIPFTEFYKRPDWPKNPGGNGELDLEAIQSLAFEPVQATFSDDFEDGDASGWWSITETVLITEVVSPGAGGSLFALQASYDIADGQAGLGVSPSDDWSALDGLSFDLLGTNSGNYLRIELVEGGNERWAHTLRDDFTGWQQDIELLWEMFSKRDWQPDDADENDLLDLDDIKDIIFSPLPGWLQDDFEDQNIDDWWQFADSDGSTVTRELVMPGAQDSGAAIRVDFDLVENGWAGVGKTVGVGNGEGEDWRGYQGVSLWVRGTGSATRIMLKDADDEEFAHTLTNLPSEWTLVEFAWTDFSYRSGSGDGLLSLENVQALMMQPINKGETRLEMDKITVMGDGVGEGVFTIDNVAPMGDAVRSGNGIAAVDEIWLMGESDLPTYPNVVKFAVQWDQYGLDDWQGPLYTGYQDPAPFYLADKEVIASGIVTFLAAAQDAYDQTVPTATNRGPFMPLFVQDRRYSATNDLGWTWDGSKADANTHWAQFQYRTFAHLAKYYFLSGDPAAKAILDDFHAWLRGQWTMEGDRVTVLPTEMITQTEGVKLDYRPGDFGLAAQGLIYLAATCTDDATYRTDAEALLATLIEQQDELGAFPNDIYRFGFEQAEAGIALMLYDLLLNEAGMDLKFYDLMGSECRCYVRLPLIMKED